MIWLDLDVEPPPDTGTPSVEAHKSAVDPRLIPGIGSRSVIFRGIKMDF